MPVQGTCTTRTFGGYCMRRAPARSAAAYAQKLQQNTMISDFHLPAVCGAAAT